MKKITPRPTSEHGTLVRKNLEAIMGMGYHQYRVYEDWIALMFFAFQRDDESYLEVMNRYRNEKPEGKREADYFSNALGALILHMRETNRELLGLLFEEYASSHYKGQFFTPHHLCELMAQLTYEPSAPEQESIRIFDPACGAGAMLLAVSKIQTMADQNKSLFVAQDVDLNCVRMCALNLMFFNLEGLIVWGNTLAVEAREAWHTKRSFAYGGSLHPYPAEEAKRIIEAGLLANMEQQKKDSPSVSQSRQLSLF